MVPRSLRYELAEGASSPVGMTGSGVVPVWFRLRSFAALRMTMFGFEGSRDES
jgi:hypothetical protein